LGRLDGIVDLCYDKASSSSGHVALLSTENDRISGYYCNTEVFEVSIIRFMEIFGKKYDIGSILALLVIIPFALVALAYAILFIIFSLAL